MSAVVSIDSANRNKGRESITVRKLNLEFGDDIPEFWFDDNAFLTMFLTALSVSFPAGERFFIDSVRHYQKQITDKDLARDIRNFIGQEANHTLEHNALNALMDRKGYPASGMAAFVRKRIAEIQKKSTPEANLARTAALEHFTAILAGAMLDHPDALDKMHPTAAKIWAWHAVEEVEHRAVAFDVYKQMVDDEALRRRIMFNVTVLFITINSIRTVMLMQRSGNLFNLKSWAKGLNLLWGKPGVFRQVIPQYFAYYRKDFHPLEHDYSASMENAKRRYLDEA